MNEIGNIMKDWLKFFSKDGIIEVPVMEMKNKKIDEFKFWAKEAGIPFKKYVTLDDCISVCLFMYKKGQESKTKKKEANPKNI